MTDLRALGETRGENFMNDATAFSIHFRMSAKGNQFRSLHAEARVWGYDACYWPSLGLLHGLQEQRRRLLALGGDGEVDSEAAFEYAAFD
jgi:hypothetical protein